MSLLGDYYKKTKKKIYDTFNPMEQKVSSGLGSAYKSAKNYLNNDATVGGIIKNTFKPSNLADSLMKIPEHKFTFADDLSWKNPAFKLPASLLQGTLNTFHNTVDYSREAADQYYGNKKYDLGALTGKGLNAALDLGGLAFGGGKAEKLLQSGAKTVGARVAPSLKKAMWQGAKDTSKIMGRFGAGYSLADSLKNHESLPKTAMNVAQGYAGGRVAGGALGAGLPALAAGTKAATHDLKVKMGKSYGKTDTLPARTVKTNIEPLTVSKGYLFTPKKLPAQQFNPNAMQTPGVMKQIGAALPRPGMTIKEVANAQARSNAIIARKKAAAEALIKKQISNQRAGLDTAEKGFVAPQAVVAPKEKIFKLGGNPANDEALLQKAIDEQLPKAKITTPKSAFQTGPYNRFQQRAYDKKGERVEALREVLNYPNELRKIGYKKNEIEKIGKEQAEKIIKLGNLGFPKNAMPKDLLSDQVDRIIKNNVSWRELKDYHTRKNALNTNFLQGVDPETLKDINPLMVGGRDVYRNFEVAFGKNYPKLKQQLLDPFDAAKGNLFKEQEALTNEVFEQVVKKLGIKKGSALDKAVVAFGEGKMSLQKLQETFPGSWQKVIKADSWFRNKYPELLSDLNAVREANFPTHPLYPESTKIIPQRKDYYRHGKEMEGISGLRNMFEGAASIDPALAAASDVTNPKTKWLSFAQKRKGDANDFGAVEGYLDYIKNHSYAKHIDPFIQKFKGVDDEAKDFLPKGAFSGSDTRRGLAEELSQKIDPVQQIADSTDPAQIKQILISKGVSEPQSEWMSQELANVSDLEKTRTFLKSKLAKNTGKQLENLNTATAPAELSDNKENNFLVFIKNFSRDLAGKTNPIDRPFQENLFGRKALNIVNWANSRFKANAVLGNLSSSLAQFFNIPQGFASAGAKNSAKGLGKSLAGIFKENGPINQSSFIRERYFKGYNKFDTGILNNTKKFAVWMTGIGDKIGTKFIWNSHYQKALGEGIPNPVKYADDWTRKMVAGRGIGEVPIAQKSKITQLLAPFQLEVANQWYALRDIAKNDPRKLTVAVKMIEFSAASYFMNRVVKEIRGSDVSFDPINAMVEAYGEYQNEDDKIKGAFKAGGRVAGEIFSNIPGGQTVASAYPEYGFGINKENHPTMAKVLNTPRKELFGEGDPTRFGTGGLPLFSAIKNPLTGVILPYGGKQLEKTYSGAKALMKGYTENNAGKVMTPVDQDITNVMQGLMFGKNALSEMQDYFDNKQAPLSDLQTEKFKLLGNDPGFFNKVLAERKADNEREALKEGKEQVEVKDLSDDMSQLSNGNIYVKTLNQEFKTEKLARLAIDKDDFMNSEDKTREHDGNFWYKDANGEFRSKTVAARMKDLDKASSNLEMDRAFAKNDLEAWGIAAEKKLKALDAYAQTLDPAIDQDEIDALILERENLLEKANKYASYGGFKKGKSASSQIESQSQLISAQMAGAKAGKDLGSWLDLADKKMQVLNAQLEDPELSDLKRERIQNTIIDLTVQAARYKRYGDFQQPKKPKEIAEKYKYPLIDPAFMKINALVAGVNRPAVITRRPLSLVRRRLPLVRRTRRR